MEFLVGYSDSNLKGGEEILIKLLSIIVNVVLISIGDVSIGLVFSFLINDLTFV
jgi:hypothetical protein